MTTLHDALQADPQLMELHERNRDLFAHYLSDTTLSGTEALDKYKAEPDVIAYLEAIERAGIRYVPASIGNEADFDGFRQEYSYD